MAMLRIANPSISVRLRVAPPPLVLTLIYGKTHYARVVESVDTRDLKSLAGNSVPVQVWPRVPSIDDKKASQSGAFLYPKYVRFLMFHSPHLIDLSLLIREFTL